MHHQQEIHYMIHLLKCAISDTPTRVPPPDLDWELIYTLSVKHKICSTLYFGIKKLPKDLILKIPHIDSYILSYKTNLVADANRSYELKYLQPILDNHGIDYIFLKGSVIKNYYPDSSVRRMSDIDILFRGADFRIIDSIFKNLGYEILHKNAKDTAYIKHSCKVAIEMQPHLIDKGYTEWYEYLENIWDRCTHQHHEYKMSLEDFYIYHIIHMAKHFKNGGIGLTHLVDVYIMLENFQHADWNYINKELSKIHLAKFNETIKALVNHWFACEPFSNFQKEDMDLLTAYIFRSGAFGTKKQQEVNMISFRGDKKLSIRKKLFPGIETMINYYGKSLSKHKYLLPLYWIRLNADRLFHYNQKTKKVIRNISSITESEISKTEKIMKLCGLE